MSLHAEGFPVQPWTMMEAKGSPRGALKAPAGVFPRADKYVILFMK